MQGLAQIKATKSAGLVVSNPPKGTILQKKSQSAMEYLMTYGWAILIIAIVLVALFQLGIFNSNSLAPRAQPGACQVFKTTATTTLEGECNNALPQYVALFNGASSVITTGNAPSVTKITISAWIFIPTTSTDLDVGGQYESIMLIGSAAGQCTSGYFGIHYSTDGTTGTEHCATSTSQINAIKSNAWQFFTATYDGTNYCGYINGQQTFCVSGSQFYNTLGQIWLGGNNFGGYVKESMANVQIYNTSLSPNDISAMYYEGIGGAPINTYNLVAWYPLNGNANDYSGNLNNGAATGVIYSSSYTNSYSPP